MYTLLNIIQIILLLVSAFLIIISAVGLVSFNNDLKNANYARIHIIGIFDVACVIALIGLGQYLFAGIYFIIAPFTAHAIANAYYRSEDGFNNPNLCENVENVENNPFIYSKEEVRKLDQKANSSLNDAGDNFSVSTLDIDEGE